MATEGGDDSRSDEDVQHSGEGRTIYVNVPVDKDHLDEDGSLKAYYPRNKVRTARYTPLTFLPKNLWFQFHNVANLYFLLLVILQCFSIFGATNAGLSAVPLIVIVVITAIKDAIEDWRRTVLDNELNNTPTRMLKHWHNVNSTDEHIGIWRRIKKATSRLLRLIAARRKGVQGDPLDLDRIQTRPSGEVPRYSMDNRLDLVDSHARGAESFLEPSAGNPYDSQYAPAKHNYGSLIDRTSQTPGKAAWHKTYWKNVRVGDFVKLRNNDAIPADMVVLATSEADSACYVETKNLDGETNLKIKHGLRAGSQIKTPIDCEAARFRIESEGPNPNLYSYSAVARWLSQPTHMNDDAEEKFEAISAETLLLRGSSLRNTAWVIGVVVFTGDDTKIMQNSGASPSKRSRISRELNWTIISNFFILFLMCVVCAIANGIYLNHRSSTFNVFDQGSQAGSAAAGGVVTFFTCLILFQNLVPISLYISIEIVKTLQAYFIYSDVDMYHHELDYPCTPKSWNISDDLGQIEYIFSDKTGTLTQNVMEFKKCTINGIAYGEAYTEAMIGMAKRDNLDTDEVTRRERARIGEDRVQMNSLMQAHSNNPYYVPEELTFVSSQFIQHLHGQNGKEQAQACSEFMKALALCHNVLVERPEGRANYLDYKAQSPDEAALVGTARDVGFAMPERTQRGLILEADGRRDEYIILDELEFNSSRKRMSMIFKTPDNRIILYCKGADSVIYNRLATNQTANVKEITARDLDQFANEGLRTLGIAYRELSEAHYQEWQKRHQAAAASLENREERIAESCDEIEQELILLGGTAIEDRLQDGVPESIALLGEAGIKLWVLTGDKVETAINIGFSCNLLDNNMNVVRFQVPGNKQDDVEALLDINLQKFGMTGSVEELKLAMKNHDPPAATHALVIDGEALKLVLKGNDGNTQRKFLLLCKQMKSVLCCRVSPAQKAEVVKMVKNGLDVMTLSIGDGANDVAMIQQADVGVGIAGVEGRQAVMSSDYALGQFRFLSKLLLVHGRWSYRRIAEMVACFFNKNIVWTFTLFWFQIFDQFDGQYNFDYTYILLYNLAFTSLPIIFMGAFDQDVSARVSMRVPQLYMRGILRLDWRPLKFWTYMFDGLYSSVICFFFPYLIWNNMNLGTFAGEGGNTVNTLTEQGAYIAAPAILVVNTFVLINTSRWDWLFMLIWTISNVLFWLWTGIYSQFEANVQFYKLAAHVFGSLTFWGCFVLTTITALLPRFCIIAYQALYSPSDSDIIREQVKLGYFGDDNAKPSSDTSSSSSFGKKIGKDKKQPRNPFRDGASGSDTSEEQDSSFTSRHQVIPVTDKVFDTTAGELQTVEENSVPTDLPSKPVAARQKKHSISRGWRQESR
ncbi:Phospholipid-translocating P-type ATPase domain-containing protein [Taphrina deformans PYCC 5710]|uniref:Phospholipid-transporting ATPase n=1 Tax=Taphrina deformans (strain PYCC 5710 / ATCC 11124 / CBS 356.35 / IMI 108563 / JCM 9778 / NBRC 8474) TaxID=1097556 RepID=R4X762_TAPDE|nr:Phospholipid-translocating P-type ATPase domain-containing protein [Taphrina deformans PYCC 5710]|eukprot:CCG81132.2 Phospholipid-translocating P-type ATPase domain-containing protein [Taphrina deformans PYCC 5710]